MLWTALSTLWASTTTRKGAIFLGAFILPFGLLAIGFARLPWRGRWLTWLWAALVGTALATRPSAAISGSTRDVFWNPSVIVGNAYAPFFRVNSVFWDPSIYGRYLAVAILATLTGILLGGVSRWKLVGLFAVVVATWAACSSRSRSRASSRSRAVSSSRRRSSGAGRAVVGLVALGVLVRRSRASRSRASATISSARRAPASNAITSGRANLVSQGLRIARDHPLDGVGVGGFKQAYAERHGLKGTDPKKAASHTTPVTVAAEEASPGLALLVWLLAGGARRDAARARARLHLARLAGAGLVLVAIAVHSLFYNAFFEDPMTWAVFGLVGLTARVPKKGGPVAPRSPAAPAEPPVPEPAPTATA